MLKIRDEFSKIEFSFYFTLLIERPTYRQVMKAQDEMRVCCINGKRGKALVRQ